MKRSSGNWGALTRGGGTGCWAGQQRWPDLWGPTCWPDAWGMQEAPQERWRRGREWGTELRPGHSLGPYHMRQPGLGSGDPGLARSLLSGDLGTDQHKGGDRSWKPRWRVDAVGSLRHQDSVGKSAEEGICGSCSSPAEVQDTEELRDQNTPPRARAVKRGPSGSEACWLLLGTWFPEAGWYISVTLTEERGEGAPASV